MNVITILCVMCLVVQACETRVLTGDYDKRRNEILEQENLISLGGRLTLTDDEQAANENLMQWKRREIDDSFHNPRRFNFSKHYFAYEHYIEQSKVYQIIRRMPKGAALHVHSSYMLDKDALIELTYEDHLYACYHSDLQLHFSDGIPTRPCSVKWTLLSELRNASDKVVEFDAQLKKHFTLVNDYDDVQNTDINTVWEGFGNFHRTVKSLISYRPVREKYLYKALEKFYEDNVMYVEIRSGLGQLYELDGTIHEKMYLAHLYRNVTNQFIKDHPDFMGIKLILTCKRVAPDSKVKETLELAKKLKEEMPDIFAGFDLVGQEDMGRPLKEFYPILEEYKDEINFYFHAGETSWFGTTSDENLVDAILLGSKRIGHSYALLKHPNLLNMVIQNNIALEVNVISNAVLALVRDIRNHPLATYLALGMPVVLSSDDPGAWGADPLSHDFYVAFVGVASKNYDLRLLKQLAINSIRYSALDSNDKTKMTRIFNVRWNKFIKELSDVNCKLAG